MVKPRYWQRGNVVTLCHCPRACHVPTCARVTCCRTMLPLFADFDAILWSDHLLWLTFKLHKLFSSLAIYHNRRSKHACVTVRPSQWLSDVISMHNEVGNGRDNAKWPRHRKIFHMSGNKKNRYNCENWKQVQLLYHTKIHLFDWGNESLRSALARAYLKLISGNVLWV